MSSAATHDARLERWGAGGLGLRVGGTPEDPRWVARSARPLLLVRRTADGYREETFAFDEPSGSPEDFRGAAVVRDETGALWAVQLRLSPEGGNGFAGELRWTLRGGVARGVFVGLALELIAAPCDLYVLMPGGVYDGNDVSEYIRDIPRVSRSGVLHVPTTSLAAPCAAFHARSSGWSAVIATAQRAASPGSRGLTTGFVYDARRAGPPTASVMAPFVRTEWYHLRSHEGEFRFHMIPQLEAGHDLDPGGWIELPLRLVAGADPSVCAFFRRVHELRPAFRAHHARAKVLPLSEAAALVEHNFNRYHWRPEGFYANAVEADGTVGSAQLLSGWCSGIISAYALLGCGSAESRRRAAGMIDFICATGPSPSGLFYGAYQDGAWQSCTTADPGPDVTPWHHIRMSEDATFYLLRAFELELSRARRRDSWLEAAVSNLDAFVRLWTRHGEFGHFIDLSTGEMLRGGSAAGTLCIACLAVGARLVGNSRYRDVAREAADAYYARFTSMGHTTGGPLDVKMAPDSESCLMFPEAYMAVWDATGEPRFLGYAVDAADQLASWVLAYDGVFPPGSTLDRRGVQTTGGIIASAQNHHIGPGGATTSLSSLLTLYRATGEERFLRLLEDCASGLPQYVSRHDGDLDRLSRGMMTEQINLADAMNHAQGEIWNISASWGATNVLLTRLELPGVYLDPGRRRLAVFDHLEAAADWSLGTVMLRNPTPYAASSAVEIEGSGRREVLLGPVDRVTMRMEE